MNLTNYHKAKRYAEKVTHGHDYTDIVHDAFIKWYEKTETDLFDQNLPVIFKVLKYTILSRWEKSHVYMENGEKKVRSFDGFIHDASFNPPQLTFSTTVEEDVDVEQFRKLSAAALSKMTRADLPPTIRPNREEVSEKMRRDHIFVLDMLVEGYDVAGIAEKMGVTDTHVRWLIKNVRGVVAKLL